MTGTFRETAVFVRDEDTKPSRAVLLTFDYREEEGKWLAECFELGTATFADTLKEAQADLHDAVTLQLNEVDKLGYTNEFLRSHGVKIVHIQASSSGQPWSAATETIAV